MQVLGLKFGNIDAKLYLCVHSFENNAANINPKMRLTHLFCSFTIYLSSLPLLAQIQATWTPDQMQELGVVEESQGTQERQFSVSNTGDYSWQILRGYTSCGCTKVDLEPEQIVRPGDSAQVRVTFDPMGKAGPFREVVTIQLTDGEDINNQKLILTGEVRRSAESLRRQFPFGQDILRLNTNKVDFGEVSRGSRAERHIVICNVSDQVQQFHWTTSSALIHCDAESDLQLYPQETLDLTLQWDGTSEHRWGLTQETLTITDQSGQTLQTDLRAVLLPDVSHLSEADKAQAPSLLTDRRINIGPLSAGQKTTQQITIQNRGGRDLHLYRIYSEQAQITSVSALPAIIPAGHSATIRLQIIPRDASDIPITIISDDAKRPRQTIRMGQK